MIFSFSVWPLDGWFDDTDSCIPCWVFHLGQQGQCGEDPVKVHHVAAEIPQVIKNEKDDRGENTIICFRSKFKPGSSTTKFQDAMLLIDQTREAWQIFGTHCYGMNYWF